MIYQQNKLRSYIILNKFDIFVYGIDEYIYNMDIIWLL